MRHGFLTVIGVLALGAAQAWGEGETRTWTSTSGSKIEAEFLGVEGSLVTLRTVDGKTLGIALTKLSADDRTWVKGQTAPEAGAPAAATGKPAEEPPAEAAPANPDKPKNQLRGFPDGDWAGYNAVFIDQKYEAGLRADGWIDVFPKDRDGTRVHKPFRMNAQYVVRNSATGSHGPLGVDTIESDPAPTMKAGEIVWTGALTDGTRFENGVQFTKNGIALWGAVLVEKTGKNTPRPYLTVKMEQSFDIDDDWPLEKKEDVVGDAVLVMEPVTGQKVELPYHTRGNMPKACKSIKIGGKLYGARKIEFESGSKDVPIGMLGGYTITPYAGFSFGVHDEEGLGGKQKKLTCSIK
jgi:hypothetical protein